jgi:hypothetical protein
LLVKFDNGESINGSEILHIINKKKFQKVSIRELVRGRNELTLSDFSGDILKQRSDGTGWIVGNSYEIGKKSGVAVLSRKKGGIWNNQEKKTRIANQCWDVYYERYVDGVLVYEHLLGSYCEEDTAPGDGDIGGGVGGNGPSNEIISSTLTDPCYKEVLRDLLTNSYNMHAVLQDILPNFNSNENLILNITQEANGPSGQDAEMMPMGTVGGAKKYQIALNDAALSGAGKEYIAVTMLHEVLHAHFDAAGINLDHHSNMANLYVGPMAHALGVLYGMPVQTATALAWGGLHGTDAWNNLSSTDRDFYQYANNLWRNSQNPRATAPGTKCN